MRTAHVTVAVEYQDGTVGYRHFHSDRLTIRQLTRRVLARLRADPTVAWCAAGRGHTVHAYGAH
jgi:hypothetical protein